MKGQTSMFDREASGFAENVADCGRKPIEIESGAVFSPDRAHRYTLWRKWDHTKPPVNFVCLNPSTADESANDPTVARCINYARRWGHGSLIVTNIFALRSTDPRGLRRVDDPIGPENDQHIVAAAEAASRVIAAWGTHGLYLLRGFFVLDLIGHLRVECLKVTKDGHPVHPLYQPADARPIPYPLPGARL